MKEKQHLCQSCNCLIRENENYCSICGQKKIFKTASLGEVFGNFFSTIFSIDSKLIRTLIPLCFIPGKLTNEYLLGKRQRYFEPIRMFLFWMTSSLIFLNIISSKNFEGNDLDRNANILIQIQKDSIYQKLKTVFPDSINQIKIEKALRVSKEEGKNSSETKKDRPNLFLYDILQLSPEQIFKKYQIKRYWSQQIARQFIKALKTQDGFSSYLMNHLSWVIILSIPLFAFLLKILYLRQKRSYVEHLIYTLHLHTFIFIVSSLLFIYNLLTKGEFVTYTAEITALLLIGIYFIFSLNKVYGQTKIKTIIKVILFSIGYCIILVIATIIFLIINLLLF